MNQYLLYLALAANIAMPLAVAEAQEKRSMETIYFGGPIVTMLRSDDIAEAVAVRRDKIVAVGSLAEVRKAVGKDAESIDLHGKALLPGFYAAHDHFPSWGRTSLYQVDLNSPPIGTVRRMDELVEALRAKAAETAQGEWIVGRGYDDTLLAERRHPTRQDLDRASTEHPIWIVHTSGHLGVANSRALARAKVTRDTPQTSGGRIHMDADGEPTGVIEERTSLVGRLTPALNLQQRLQAIRHSDAHYLSKGVTTTVIAGSGGSVVPDLVKANQRGGLRLRALAMLGSTSGPAMTLEKAAALSPVPSQVRVSGVKMWHDGSLQGFTGYLTAPYHAQPEGKSDYAGYPSRSRERLVEMVGKYHRAGYQVAIHGNGDAAIDDILYAFRVVQQEHPRPDARHRIEHCQTPREDQLDTMRELGITPSFFVGHVYYWGDRHQDIFLGQERAARISPLASAARRGIRFTVHNDTPVTPVDPLLLVWCSVNRLTKAGRTLGPEQRIGVYQALRAVTIDAAWQNFEEATKGSLESGKLADFVILDENPLSADPARLKDIGIAATVIGGRPVFER
jgi:predicted amidohydrolase YtcJ